MGHTHPPHSQPQSCGIWAPSGGQEGLQSLGSSMGIQKAPRGGNAALMAVECKRINVFGNILLSQCQSLLAN
jgi:hypothetical protein